MELGIQGKVALITGGDSGIGCATAKLLAAEGVKIALLDKEMEPLRATVEEVSTVGKAFPVQADLGNLSEVEAARDQIVSHYGTVDMLVNCAGITGATGDFMEISDDEWHEAIEVNLMGAIRVCRTFIPLMQESGWGRVVLVTSEDAVQPYTDEMPYCAAKAGLLNFTKNLSKAYAKDGVLANSVSPAFIATPMTDAMMEKRADKLGVSFDEAIATFLKEKRPHLELQRRGEAQEVAAVIAFLCSQLSSFVVGANYRVDGGAVAGISL